MNGLLHHCHSLAEVGDKVRPGIVHRLDKDTSGVMVVAKNNMVHQALVEIFKEHKLQKEYLALVHGIPRPAEGRIVASIGRHPVQRQKMAIREVGGKYAASSWELLSSYTNHSSLMRVVIETGRTHQIRVHMAHLGHPVAGDQVYGKNRDNERYGRQMLHASRLCFTHPVTGRKIDQTARLWPDFEAVLQEMVPSQGELP